MSKKSDHSGLSPPFAPTAPSTPRRNLSDDDYPFPAELYIPDADLSKIDMSPYEKGVVSKVDRYGEDAGDGEGDEDAEGEDDPDPFCDVQAGGGRGPRDMPDPSLMLESRFRTTIVNTPQGGRLAHMQKIRRANMAQTPADQSPVQPRLPPQDRSPRARLSDSRSRLSSGSPSPRRSGASPLTLRSRGRSSQCSIGGRSHTSPRCSRSRSFAKGSRSRSPYAAVDGSNGGRSRTPPRRPRSIARRSGSHTQRSRSRSLVNSSRSRSSFDESNRGRSRTPSRRPRTDLSRSKSNSPRGRSLSGLTWSVSPLDRSPQNSIPIASYSSDRHSCSPPRGRRSAPRKSLHSGASCGSSRASSTKPRRGLHSSPREPLRDVCSRSPPRNPQTPIFHTHSQELPLVPYRDGQRSRSVAPIREPRIQPPTRASSVAPYTPGSHRQLAPHLNLNQIAEARRRASIQNAAHSTPHLNAQPQLPHAQPQKPHTSTGHTSDGPVPSRVMGLRGTKRRLSAITEEAPSPALVSRTARRTRSRDPTTMAVAAQNDPSHLFDNALYNELEVDRLNNCPDDPAFLFHENMDVDEVQALSEVAENAVHARPTRKAPLDEEELDDIEIDFAASLLEKLNDDLPLGEPPQPRPGRRSDLVNAQIHGAASVLERVLIWSSHLIGVAPEIVLREWTKQKGRTSSGHSAWNIFQSYIAVHENLQDELAESQIELAGPTPTNAEVAKLWKSFTARVKDDASDLLDAWAGMQVLDKKQTVSQRKNFFNSQLSSIKRKANWLSRSNAIEVVVAACGTNINQDASLGFVHMTPLAKGFFDDQLRMDSNTFLGHLKAFTSYSASAAAVTARHGPPPAAAGPSKIATQRGPPPETTCSKIAHLIPYVGADLLRDNMELDAPSDWWEPGDFTTLNGPGVTHAKRIIMIKDRFVARAKRGSVIFPRTQVPWLKLSAQLYFQGIQIIGLPDCAPWPGFENQSGRNRGVGGLPAPLALIFLMHLPDVDEKGIQVIKLSEDDATRQRKGLLPVMSCRAPNHQSPFPNAKQLWMDGIRMWQTRTGPQRRLPPSDREVDDSDWHPLQPFDQNMEAKLMSKNGLPAPCTREASAKVNKARVSSKKSVKSNLKKSAAVVNNSSDYEDEDNGDANSEGDDIGDSEDFRDDEAEDEVPRRSRRVASANAQNAASSRWSAIGSNDDEDAHLSKDPKHRVSVESSVDSDDEYKPPSSADSNSAIHHQPRKDSGHAKAIREPSASSDSAHQPRKVSNGKGKAKAIEESSTDSDDVIRHQIRKDSKGKRKARSKAKAITVVSEDSDNDVRTRHRQQLKGKDKHKAILVPSTDSEAEIVQRQPHKDPMGKTASLKRKAADEPGVGPQKKTRLVPEVDIPKLYADDEKGEQPEPRPIPRNRPAIPTVLLDKERPRPRPIAPKTRPTIPTVLLDKERPRPRPIVPKTHAAIPAVLLDKDAPKHGIADHVVGRQPGPQREDNLADQHDINAHRSSNNKDTYRKEHLHLSALPHQTVDQPVRSHGGERGDAAEDRKSCAPAAKQGGGSHGRAKLAYLDQHREPQKDEHFDTRREQLAGARRDEHQKPRGDAHGAPRQEPRRDDPRREQRMDPRIDEHTDSRKYEVRTKSHREGDHREPWHTDREPNHEVDHRHPDRESRLDERTKSNREGDRVDGRHADRESRHQRMKSNHEGDHREPRHTDRESNREGDHRHPNRESRLDERTKSNREGDRVDDRESHHQRMKSVREGDHREPRHTDRESNHKDDTRHTDLGSRLDERTKSNREDDHIDDRYADREPRHQRAKSNHEGDRRGDRYADREPHKGDHTKSNHNADRNSRAQESKSNHDKHSRRQNLESVHRHHHQQKGIPDLAHKHGEDSRKERKKEPSKDRNAGQDGERERGSHSKHLVNHEVSRKHDDYPPKVTKSNERHNPDQHGHREPSKSRREEESGAQNEAKREAHHNRGSSSRKEATALLHGHKDAKPQDASKSRPKQRHDSVPSKHRD